jgi:hypothetical protein
MQRFGRVPYIRKEPLEKKFTKLLKSFTADDTLIEVPHVPRVAVSGPAY